MYHVVYVYWGKQDFSWRLDGRSQHCHFSLLLLYLSMFFFIYNLYSSPNIIRMIKSRRMSWTGHVAQMGRRGMHVEY
jgi:hypothetical protein